MNASEIQKRVDELSKAMTAKGLREPDFSFSIRSHNDLKGYATWKAHNVGSRFGNEKYEFFHGSTPQEVIDKATAFIASLPSAEEAKRDEFLKALGGVIDLGKSSGIEVEVLNPLLATMKRLSENALTSQVAA